MMNNINMVKEQEIKSTKALRTACYIRLSREDGDRAESLSITNQRLLLTEFINYCNDLELYDFYIDDGISGTHFERPDFKRMIADIESKKVECIVVKDLSRLGREISETTKYVMEYFPSKKVRFIAIADNIDKNYYDIDTGVDMLIEFKNMFNGLYPKDIANKVRSTFKSKQKKGQFIGAFASYGYMKSPIDHNQLIVDENAACIVRRIFQMYMSGIGQLTIAKILNEECIPCPSEYKKLCGMNYRNSNRHEKTSYWTYSTIHKMLQNEMYTGAMVQNKNFRQICKQKAVSLPKEQWIIVKDVHEAIIDRDTWEKVQMLLTQGTRQMNLKNNLHMFAGFFKCGDCDRAMVKIKRHGVNHFNCGSYNRYGRTFCSMHAITEPELEKIILNDLNVIIQSVKDISQLIEEEQKKNRNAYSSNMGDISKYQNDIEKTIRKKERAYEHYMDDIISKEEYIKYKTMCEKEISTLESKIEIINQLMEEKAVTKNPWIERLLQYEDIEHLDRETVVEIISSIYIYENNTVKIVYNFSDELEALLEKVGADVSPIIKE